MIIVIKFKKEQLEWGNYAASISSVSLLLNDLVWRSRVIWLVVSKKYKVNDVKQQQTNMGIGP